MPMLVAASTGGYTAPDKSLPRDERIRQEMRYWWNAFQYGRWGIEREWYRNILFYIGHQWIRYHESTHQWRTENLQEWIPRPVTNRLSATANVIRSALMSADPRFSAEPRIPESDLSVSGARAARDALDILYADSQFRAARRNASSWLVLAGTSFYGVDVSTSTANGTIDIPGERCLGCGLQLKPSELAGKCPECEGDLWIEDTDVSETVPRSRLLTTSWSPFEVYLDSGVLDIEQQPAIILSRSYHVETARQAWKDKADQIKPSTNLGSAQYLMSSLATSAASFRGVTSPTHMVTRRLYRKPCEAWPDGLAATLTSDGIVLEANEGYPYRMKSTQQPFYPLVPTVYDEVPGRFWGKTPISDLVHKQAQRNRVESMWEMCLMTSAGPVWLIPSGSNPSKITGKPNIQITATPVSGMMPARIQGMGPDASVIQMIEKIDQDFEEVASVFSVLKGKQPGGVRAFQAMRLLEDRGMGRFGSVFENLEATYEKWGTYSLELYRQFAMTPLVRRAKSEFGLWTQQQFLRSDLSTDVDIRVESGSARPKSSIAKLDAMQRLQAMGAIDTRYPEQRLRMLEESGMLSMIPGVERDMEAAMRENAEFHKWASTLARGALELSPEELQALISTSQPPVHISLLVDEHVSHFIHHRRYALSDEYRGLPEPFKRWWEDQHMAGHLDAYGQIMDKGGIPGQLQPLMPQKPTVTPPKAMDAASQRM